MTEPPATDAGWYDGVDRDDPAAATEAIANRTAEAPRDWPTRAVESGFAADEADYYDALHGASMAATRAAARKRERADDRQLIHAVRAMSDCQRVANELAERVSEWAKSKREDAGAGVEYARQLADEDGEEALVSLATCRAYSTPAPASPRRLLAHSDTRSASSLTTRWQSSIARILRFNCWSSALSRSRIRSRAAAVVAS